jgi:hypothetical protein
VEGGPASINDPASHGGGKDDTSFLARSLLLVAAFVPTCAEGSSRTGSNNIPPFHAFALAVSGAHKIIAWIYTIVKLKKYSCKYLKCL